jgi:serine/threonine protein kinase
MDETTTSFSDMRLLSSAGTAAHVIGTQSIGLLEAGPELLRDDLSVTRLGVHTETGALVCIKSIPVPHPSSVPQALRAAGGGGGGELLETAPLQPPTAGRRRAGAEPPSKPLPVVSERQHSPIAGGPFSAPATVAWLASKEFCQHLVEVKRLSQHSHISSWTDIIRTHKELHFVMPYLSGGPIMNAVKLRHVGFLARASNASATSAAPAVIGDPLDGTRSNKPNPSSASTSGTVFGNRMNEDEARFYFQQLISAIKFSHLRDLPHGDLHPDNIWLENELVYDPTLMTIDKKSYQLRPKLKVVNFGFAAVRVHSNGEGQELGEPGHWFSRATISRCIEAITGNESTSSSPTSKQQHSFHPTDLDDLIHRVSCAAPELFVPSTETFQTTHSSSTAATATATKASVIALNEDHLKRCDVWSCGVLLFMFLTGESPFPLQQVPSAGATVADLGGFSGDVPSSALLAPLSATAAAASAASSVQALEIQIGDMIDRMHNGDVSFPAYLSPGVRGVRHLIASMLTPDPVKRITIKDIISHPWFDVRLERSLMGGPSAKITSTTSPPLPFVSTSASGGAQPSIPPAISL